MPRERKKRGRRAEEQKRKRDHDDVDDEPDAKRPRPEEDQIPFQSTEYDEEYDGDFDRHPSGNGPAPFYGLLDDSEQEYFKRADEMLEFNSFGHPEERELFLENVFKEANGKALKLACSQSCSRLMERLILAATPDQLKTVFQEFCGHFIHLFQHRFASHCCEALFVQAAPSVTDELRELPQEDLTEENVTPPITSFENLYLSVVGELEGNLGFLLTHRFASHTLRLLLLILAGKEVSSYASLLQSKRKEQTNFAGGFNEDSPSHKRPHSFKKVLHKLIRETVAGLETHYLRALATHPTGNPTLQLLLRLELDQFGKQKAKERDSLLHRLLPDDPITPGTDSGTFISGLLFDPVGSHLLETIIELAPGKLFKTIYRGFIRDRLAALTKDDVAGYIVSKVLERLSKEDLEGASRSILTAVPSLVERNRVTILKSLIERYQVRALDPSPIAKQLEFAYAEPRGMCIRKLLKLGDAPASSPLQPGLATPTPSSPPQSPTTSVEKLHASLLAQTMLSQPGPLSDLVFDALVRSGTATALEIARDPIASRTLQAALTSLHASIIFRRKMIQQLYGHVGALATHPAASHVIDAVWEGTHGLAFIRERCAEELAENEAELRGTHVGRAVWRNWKMDLYKRRRADWVKQSRNAVGNNGFQSFPEGGDVTQPGKTRIQLAREKHAALRAAERRRGGSRGQNGTRGVASGMEAGLGQGVGAGSPITDEDEED